MAQIALIFRIEIGFDPERGYAALIHDPAMNRQKALKGNSMEQLASRLRHVLIDEAQKARRFPLEHEEPSRIITPNGFE